MTDFSHLDALEDGLSRERQRLANARTSRERELRSVWVAQREREIAAERAFLGLEPADTGSMTIEEILAELEAD